MKTHWKRNLLLVVLAVLLVFVYFRYFWVFGTGTKAGVLNSFMNKGYVFKTYEGKIIQSGFKANVQSNEFEFSVANERIAKKLMENAGAEMKLGYKEYFGALPWRGMQRFVVDSIYEIQGMQYREGEIKPKL
ncbi:MAG TPA: hypothetical protein DCL43_03280 [Chitinophagaceae bacterium]|nr:hypothetical protein [Chitinophagaceae bacterium]HAN39397.1 hypothetical protein [Chitinophagaceae bacterium]